MIAVNKSNLRLHAQLPGMIAATPQHGESPLVFEIREHVADLRNSASPLLRPTVTHPRFRDRESRHRSIPPCRSHAHELT